MKLGRKTATFVALCALMVAAAPAGAVNSDYTAVVLSARSPTASINAGTIGALPDYAVNLGYATCSATCSRTSCSGVVKNLAASLGDQLKSTVMGFNVGSTADMKNFQGYALNANKANLTAFKSSNAITDPGRHILLAAAKESFSVTIDKAHETAASNEMASMTVDKLTGAGMKQAAIPTLWAPTTMFKNGSSDKVRGTGLQYVAEMANRAAAVSVLPASERPDSA